jgi:hypothetical protein
MADDDEAGYLQADEAYKIVKPATSTPFLIKLWKILTDPDNQSAIHWDADGQGFTIEDPGALEEILQNYFRSKQFSSFQRQLNYFTFRKSGKRFFFTSYVFTYPDSFFVGLGDTPMNSLPRIGPRMC